MISVNLRFLGRLSKLVVIGMVLACTGQVFADMQTLTDKQGRSLKANVLAVTGDQVKIKRDDGQVFNLPLASLSEADQARLKAWAAEEEKKIPAGTVNIQLSRGSFSSSKSEDTSTITIEEKWGYSVTLANRSSKQLKDLQIKYVLFVKPDAEPGKDSTEGAGA